MDGRFNGIFVISAILKHSVVRVTIRAYPIGNHVRGLRVIASEQGHNNSSTELDLAGRSGSFCYFPSVSVLCPAVSVLSWSGLIKPHDRHSFYFKLKQLQLKCLHFGQFGSPGHRCRFRKPEATPRSYRQEIVLPPTYCYRYSLSFSHLSFCGDQKPRYNRSVC